MERRSGFGGAEGVGTGAAVWNDSPPLLAAARERGKTVGTPWRIGPPTATGKGRRECRC